MHDTWVYVTINSKLISRIYIMLVLNMSLLSRALPTLVWHRKNWNILYPFTHLDTGEIDQIKKNTTYVAGFTNAAVETR